MQIPKENAGSARKARSKKPITEIYSEIVEKYWDGERNSVDPSTLTWDNGILYWWRCDDGHSYEKTIEQRLRHGCPVCHGHLVQTGVNHFSSVASEKLLSEWSAKNDGGPEAYSRGSNAKVLWACRSGHEFSMEVNHRLRRGDSCPYCSGRAIISGKSDLRMHCEGDESFSHLVEEWGRVILPWTPLLPVQVKW